RLDEGFDELALRIIAAADELAIWAVAHQQVAAARGARPSLDLLRALLFVPIIGEVSRVVAFRKTGAADEAATPAEADGQRLAALGACLVQGLLGHVLALHGLFLVINQVLERLPERV